MFQVAFATYEKSPAVNEDELPVVDELRQQSDEYTAGWYGTAGRLGSEHLQ